MKIKLTIIISPPPPEQLPPPPVQVQPIVQEEQSRMLREPGLIYMSCENCAWEGAYETLTAAKLGIAGHRGHCKKGRGRRKQLFS